MAESGRESMGVRAAPADVTRGGGGTDPRALATVAGTGSGWPPARVAVAVFVVALIVTGALTAVSFALYDSNENRLLRLRTRELALVLEEILPTIQTPLASAAALADATHGNAARFRAFVAPYVGAGGSFASASLWPPGGAGAPIAVVGKPPLLQASPARARAFLAGVERTSELRVTLVQSSATSARLGYAFSTAGNPHGYVAYAESALTPNRQAARAAPGSPFADLEFALYLGRRERPSALLSTNIGQEPITGRRSVDTVAFGDNALTIVVSPEGPLGGGFFERLPWLIAIVGAALAFAAGLLTDRLVRRRRQALELAASVDTSAEEIRQLYGEQQQIAQTLQEAILPDALPETPGLEAFALYEPGTTGVDVGGDWYDLIDVREHCIVAIVGDVSGRGLRAATTMATLRTAAFAYAAQDASPAAVLTSLSELVARRPHGYFATVLCIRIDVEAHELTLASAGHLPALLIAGDHASYLQMRVGVPIGAPRGDYEEVTVPVAAKATVIAFTDGLVERRGEVIDAGLGRLRDLALARRGQSLDELVTGLASELAPARSRDDTAILAIRWLT